MKEVGRLKEESLSETLRVLETATGLGGPNMKCPQIKTSVTQKKELSVPSTQNKIKTKNRGGGLMRDQKTVTGNL